MHLRFRLVLIPSLTENVDVEIFHIGVVEHIRLGLQFLWNGLDVAILLVGQTVIQVAVAVDAGVDVALYRINLIDTVALLGNSGNQPHMGVWCAAPAAIDHIVAHLRDIAQAVAALEPFKQLGL